jgi:hypothetical protein
MERQILKSEFEITSNFILLDYIDALVMDINCRIYKAHRYRICPKYYILINSDSIDLIIEDTTINKDILSIYNNFCLEVKALCA